MKLLNRVPPMFRRNVVAVLDVIIWTAFVTGCVLILPALTGCATGMFPVTEEQLRAMKGHNATASCTSEASYTLTSAAVKSDCTVMITVGGSK